MRALIAAAISAVVVGGGLFAASSYVVTPAGQGIFGSNHSSVQAKPHRFGSFENKNLKNKKSVVHNIGW